MEKIIRNSNKLTKGSLLTTNIIINIVGTVAPLIVAVITIPILINELGTSRFGILSILWMVLGYFSLFDMGLSRALTKLVSENIGLEKYDRIPELFWTAMTLTVILGVIGAIIFALISPFLVTNVLNISATIQLEVLHSFYYVSISIPLIISSTGLRGFLEAFQRFGIVNAIRIPLGMLTFVGPIMVLAYSNTLTAIALILTFIRIITLLIYLIICLKLYPSLKQFHKLNIVIVKQLLSWGGWLTVSNITAPFLLYLGRIIIIIRISAEAVAYFVTPYEIIVKLLIIPNVFVSVLFPAFTQLFQKRNGEVYSLYNKSLLSIFIIMLPLTLCGYFFSDMGLTWWINKEFSDYGYQVSQYLIMGVFINSFGHLSQALIQGYGRPDLTAKLHIIELVLYIPYLWFLVGIYGINGAAIAWTIRVSISTLALLIIANICINKSFLTK